MKAVFTLQINNFKLCRTLSGQFMMLQTSGFCAANSGSVRGPETKKEIFFATWMDLVEVSVLPFDVYNFWDELY